MHSAGRKFIVLAALAFAAIAHPVLAARPAELLESFGRTDLVLATDIRCLVFDMYIANSNEQRSQGLMHIEYLGPREGMIFLYPRPSNVSMWMRNTLIPLDMLFVDTAGSVAAIHTNAVPLSETIIQSGNNTAAVIELNGGAADYFGIAPGSTVIFPANLIRSAP